MTVYLDHALAVTLMLRFLFTPLFGDASPFGFLFGFVFRCLRVILGLVVIILTVGFLLLILAFWICFPFWLFQQGLSAEKILVLFTTLAFLRAVGELLLRFRKEAGARRRRNEVRWRLEVPAGENFSEGDYRAVLSWLEGRWEGQHPPFLWEDRHVLAPIGGVNRAWTGRVTPALDAYSLDLTREAQRGRLPPLIGRESSLESLAQALEKESDNNVLLVGPAGCGKTTLVFGLAREIVKGTYSPALCSKRLVSLEIGALSAGTRSGGELQERMQMVLRDIEASGNILLFIDEVHNAVTAGGGVDTSIIFASLEPHLSAGRLQMIGATSWSGYRRYIEPNEAFARLFTLVTMEEATFAETLAVLESLSGPLERKYHLYLSHLALREVIELSSRFFYERALPDKAVATLEEVMVAAAHSKPRGELIGKKDVDQFVTAKTHIPVTETGQEEAAKLLSLEEKMHIRLIGQEEAVKAIADAVRRARVGLRDPHRPITSLLFVGPTGVGKTEAAKTLAEVFFGREEAVVTLDMSEYQREDSVNRLIGSPTGLGQVSSLGVLTEKVRQNPYSLLLFDEVEKAHPKILDLFLQVLEEGRLTDAAGNTVNFANTLLIFTSNAGTDLIYRSLREGKSAAELGKDLFGFLQNNFRVELLNRFDGVIVFSPLTLPQVTQIVRLKLAKMSKTMQERGIILNFRQDLIEGLAKAGFDPALGARPLRRLLQDKVEAYLARQLLAGVIKKGQTLFLGLEVLAE